MGGVWAIHGSTDMSGTEAFFSIPRWMLAEVHWEPWLWLLVPYVAWDRRRWLNRFGHRVPRALWRRAAKNRMIGETENA